MDIYRGVNFACSTALITKKYLSFFFGLGALDFLITIINSRDLPASSSPINQCLSSLKYFVRGEVRTIINSQLNADITTIDEGRSCIRKYKLLNLLQSIRLANLGQKFYLYSNYIDHTYKVCSVRVL